MNEQSYMTPTRWTVESAHIYQGTVYPSEAMGNDYAVSVILNRIILRRSSSLESPSYYTHCLWEYFLSTWEYTCRGCGHECDASVCHCGTSYSSHNYYEEHSFVPYGCTCGYVSREYDVPKDEDPYAEARSEYQRDIMADIMRQGMR